jgi:hypothetical protein
MERSAQLSISVICLNAAPQLQQRTRIPAAHRLALALDHRLGSMTAHQQLIAHKAHCHTQATAHCHTPATAPYCPRATAHCCPSATAHHPAATAAQCPIPSSAHWLPSANSPLTHVSNSLPPSYWTTERPEYLGSADCSLDKEINCPLPAAGQAVQRAAKALAQQRHLHSHQIANIWQPGAFGPVVCSEVVLSNPRSCGGMRFIIGASTAFLRYGAALASAKRSFSAAHSNTILGPPSAIYGYDGWAISCGCLVSV